ncbi:hypothetical protein [Bacillus cereus group sp. BfR-BA-01355]|uniref:helix-turn-helix domain-containing protein n=1 Tax=Bacillus cereus group sp. BfR-BA-01355 TaxID=2920318 RepID=UPI001F5779E6|nr:hypothetical protein [Bacillus cereus group sp. BfR-BA-01355]
MSNELLSCNKVMVTYKGYGFTPKKMKKLVDKGKIPAHIIDERILYREQDIIKYVEEIDQLKKRYMTFREFMDEIGYSFPYNGQALNHKIIKFANSVNIEFYNCGEYRVNNTNYFLSRKDVKTFRDNYLNILDAAKIMNVLPVRAIRNLRIQGIDIKEINHMYNLIFVKKDDVYTYKKLKEERHGYSKNEIMKILNIGMVSLEEVLTFYKISSDSNTGLFSIKDVEKLKILQARVYKNIKEKYYTEAEIRTEIELSINTLRRYQILDYAKIKFPHIARIKEYKKNIQAVYSKKKLERYLEKREKSEYILNLKRNLSSSVFDNFRELVHMYELFFSEKSLDTEKYWLAYVKSKLTKSRAHQETIQTYLHQLIECSKILVGLTREKEIFNFSIKELNLSIFNENVSGEYQKWLYGFLKELNNSHIKKLHVEELNYKYSKKRKTKRKEKSIYKIEGYISLYNYTINTEMHKKKAIMDVKKVIHGDLGYSRYESAWLYVLLHLNNAWRHKDILEFPRVDLKKLGIASLKWLEENKLTIEIAQGIINQVKLKKFIHSKTGKRRYFLCSQELIIPLAYAIILCELRCQIVSPQSEHLINFKGNKFRNRTRNTFFEGYCNEFIFSSLKMNRTLISYMYDVIKKTTDRNPLEITKYVRTHSNIEITNIYVDIPQEHLNFMTKQLFDVGYFGYTYDMMASILLGEPPKEREKRTVRALLTKSIMGDIYKIEGIAGYLNRITEEKKTLLEYLESVSKENIQNTFHFITLGQMPAKEENYQCIFRKCEFEEIKCDMCPFAIPHFYALSTISARVVKRVKEYKEKITRNCSEGEKTRLANLLLRDMILLKEAKEKFGEDVLNEFIESGYENLKRNISELPNPYIHSSIEKKGRM